MTFLQAREIQKSFPLRNGNLEVLKKIDLDVALQDRIALIGRSGSGKSTLISILAGLESPSSGSLLLDGKSFFEIEENQRNSRRAETIGIIFQQFFLLPQLTALENVRLPLDLRNDRTADEKAYELLRAVGLEERSEHFPNELSRGECQRVAIARTLTLPVRLLLADEPTASLDDRTSEEMMELLFSLQDERKFALIVSTHDLDLAARFPQSYRMLDGRLDPIRAQQGVQSA